MNFMAEYEHAALHKFVAEILGRPCVLHVYEEPMTMTYRFSLQTKYDDIKYNVALAVSKESVYYNPDIVFDVLRNMAKQLAAFDYESENNPAVWQDPYLPEGYASQPSVTDELRRAFPGINGVLINAPCAVESPSCKRFLRSTIPGAVMHLNDAHGWTRERIADWLETLDADLTMEE